MKALGKILGLFLLGLLLIVVALLFALTHLFDPNDYKDEIRQIAHNKANLDLQLKGDIGWSLFPWLGLELTEATLASAESPEKPFANVRLLGLSVRVLPPKDVETTALGWEVAPEGLAELLARIENDYRPGPMYITENGACYDDVVGPDGEVRDEARARYLQRHLAALRQVIDDGVPVKGYFAWSLLDNFEWAEGYLRRFGLVHIDYATQQRRLKDSGKWYRSFLRQE